MSGEFAKFTQVVARDCSRATAGNTLYDVTALSRVAVLGGGPDACLLAALCLAENADVTLFSAYGSELNQLKQSGGISLRGAGPVGSYQIDRQGAPSIKTTAELDSAIADAEVIFLTGPIHKQRTYAMVLASHLNDGQIVVLAPGRSLGAIETAWHLRIGGCTADITIVETQGLPYWYDVKGVQLTLSHVDKVYAATLPSGRLDVIPRLQRFLPNLQAADSVLWSGFADGSALVEVPALLLNGPAMSQGGVNIPLGGQALPENNTFRSLIGAEQRSVIEKLASERHAVASAFGLRNLPSCDDWVDVHAGAERGDHSRPIPDQTQSQTLLRDGVIGSLVPLLSAARLTGIDVPMSQSMVTLASSILGADVAAAGRRLDTIGIVESDIDSARKAMDNIAMGRR
ncbi:NAD/NADP octopine/nopaline dehydrogenase family protein [Granulosicoccus sp.]|nr:NAD/NADP octopine/nopaline dehydrogenase family protein [Granulosicoccus sp.]MDB4223228.1 NAD/NADP octopine/nopaline dehydrogenase family protein [Granulosicoccus sp.]